MKETFKAACSAVLAALVAVDIILRRDFSFSFAMIRPPGHHSGMKSQPHGFSFLNNIAIAAEYCKKNMSKDQHCRLAIVDWDAHHG